MLLSVATAIAWLDSYHVMRHFDICHVRSDQSIWEQRSASLGSSGGGVLVYFQNRFAHNPETIKDYVHLLPIGWEVDSMTQHIGKTGLQSYPYPRSSPTPSFVNQLGFFEISSVSTTPPLDYCGGVGFVVPDLSIVLALLLIPAIWLSAWHRRRSSRSHGLCAKCGYDLRVTPDRCPEFGTTTAAIAGKTIA